MRSLISATKTRNTKGFDIADIYIIRLGGLGLISNLNNNFDEKEIKEDIDSTGYSVDV